MILLGLILLLVNLLFVHSSLLLTLSLALIVVGVVVEFVPIGGTTRRWY